MYQFFTPDQAGFNALSSRAKGACLRYQNQEMPPGASPQRASIGFERDANSNESTLWVSNGVVYTGDNDEVRQWFQEGKRIFPSFDALRAWVQSSLASAYGVNVVDSQFAEHYPIYIDADEINDRLQEKIIGQGSALKILAGVVARQHARQKPTRPAVLFAVGPSGVGKTRTCTELGSILADMRDRDENGGFLRLDMNEYQERFRLSQLIGSPNGYVGFGETSQLISTLQKNPYVTILFDEIEKSHPAILQFLMNMMDAGRISSPTDSGSGHGVDCSKATLLFTSNLKADEILKEIRNSQGTQEGLSKNAICRKHLLRAGIPREILGRIATFLVFHPLDQSTRQQILEMQIRELGEEYGVQVQSICPQTLEELSKEHGDNNYGVRPAYSTLDARFGPTFMEAARKAQETDGAIDQPVLENIG
ncbi:AAA family ATPase [uncultured Pseudodesulfovibrio sp.]|uniref:AAA family ATPase n=1 Tax=uncultured Pseudodesulfovibrio sp. TaxID=2035858 RepID=UPI0029C901BE|nr:AAA family ATPase [uncultured Pseudodesulfovibrio sp.]